MYKYVTVHAYILKAIQDHQKTSELCCDDHFSAYLCLNLPTVSTKHNLTKVNFIQASVVNKIMVSSTS